MKPIKSGYKRKIMRVYIDVGTHGGVFEFLAGPVGNNYPHLLHVYRKQVTEDLRPATLVYDLPIKKP
jgi:hypothetical protein